MDDSGEAETLESRFHYAVSCIQRLPKTGPAEQSNNEKLRFYALYKQVNRLRAMAIYDSKSNSTLESHSQIHSQIPRMQEPEDSFVRRF